MRFVVWAFIIFMPTSLLAIDVKNDWVQNHLHFVQEHHGLQLLAEGNQKIDPNVLDFEFISFSSLDIDFSRMLLVSCVEHLKSLSKNKNSKLRYGISFLDKEGNLRKEGIARISVLTPKDSKEPKVFFSVVEQLEKKPPQLKTKYVENYLEAFHEAAGAVSNN